MIQELRDLIVEYKRYYDLESVKEARKYIRKDLKYLSEQLKTIL